MKIYIIALSILFNVVLTFAQGIVPKKMSFAGMTLEFSNAARGKIQAEVNKIRKSEKHFHAMVDRSDIHFQVVNEVFKQEGFPEEIKYLMIQESAFNADAVSSSNAVGYWQFKEGTAKEVGLTVERGIDERKNLAAASRGAAAYMAKTNKKLDNWIYAVLSYNVGPGGVMKYVKDRDKGVKKMKIEGHMHWYVIKFLAHVIAYKDDVGRKVPQIDLSVETGFSGKNLKQIARSEGVEEEELFAFNRWISGSKKIPDDKEYLVILPKKGKGGNVFASDTKTNQSPNKGHTSQSGLDWPPKVSSRSKKEVSSYRKEKIGEGDAVVKYESPKENIRYKVNRIDVIVAKEGDNSHKLALVGGITKKKFIKYNEIKTFTQLEPGTTYYLKRKKGAAKLNFHVVQKGETIWHVSQMYGVRSKAIRGKNKMRSKEEPEEGRVLWLRASRPSNTAIDYRKAEVKQEVKEKKQPKESVKVAVEKEEPREKTPMVTIEENTETKDEVIHIVGEGETLYAISRQYGVAVEDIQKLNNLTQNTLSIGDRLVIKKGKEKATTIKSEGQLRKTHIVKKGDTLYSISRQFNISVSDLLKLNNKSDGTISIGEELVIE